MGSEYWPKTVEGRFLSWLLALYAFAIFGYITATIASFFVGQDRSGPASPAPETAALREEIAALRSQVAVLVGQLGKQERGLAE
jgi:voltage-gated potassium channel